MPFTCYRAVDTWPPTRHDFLSDQAKGKRPRPLQRQNPLLYTGISVFDSAAAIDRRRQDGVLRPGPTAELRIPDNAPVAIHKTLGAGHYSLVGDADQLLGCVVRMV